MNEVLKTPVVVIGIGEIGSVIARGFLRTGRPVIPVTRNMKVEVVAKEVAEPQAVVVAVGENELQAVLSSVPENWKDRLILIQNELLPRDWQQHDLDPTVISVWFEKKKGQDVKIVVPSPIYGRQSSLLAEALQSLDIPTQILGDDQQLLFELVRKNYYILTSNIAGLRAGGTVGELWEKHRGFAQKVIDDIHQVQEYLVGKPLDKEKLTQAMLVAFNGDPDHGCMGRSAPDRLKRAIAIADSAGLQVPTLREIYHDLPD